MVNDVSDFEVHLTNTTVADVLELLEAELGPLDLDCYLNATEALYNAGEIEVMLNAQVDEGLISLWLRGLLPWSSQLELARLFASRLRCTSRCTPGRDGSQSASRSNIYVEITENQERLVEWG